ncbi:MAG TPA: inositol monophosphatase family protein [Candidatus Acidoferrales bacterium]|nr:inositol monophosphatase family protein [Candidatus Acidoferrales bacterium]
MSANPLQIALDLACEAGALLLERLEHPREIAEKGRRADIVTDADRASEALIVARLRSEYPNASILGEEGGAYRGTSGDRWIVDPLDGTTNFAHGYPAFSVSIAYERDGELVAGVVFAPVYRECFAAERGAGARLGERRIAVSTIDRAADALLCTGFKPSDYERNAAQFRAASGRAQGVRRDGSAALDLAYVACGRFDGFWEFDLAPWDVAAGTLLVREAGGRVSQVDGSPARLDSPSILATNARIHEEVSAVLVEG